MSHVVRTAVRRHSQATRATLSILKELADFAHHDGITWIDQKTLASETTWSEREVRDAIRWLEERGEIETRKAQRGRRRINVYRVIVGPIGATEPDYDRLPFDLAEPFSRPAEIAGRRDHGTGTALPDTAADPAPDDDRQRLPVVAEADDRQEKHLTTGSLTRARVKDEPSRTRKTEEPNGSSVPADAGEREARRQEILLAFSAALGHRLPEITRRERGAWERAASDLADVGATSGDVTARCAAYRKVWPTMVLTALALVGHWSMLGTHVELDTAAGGIDGWLETTAVLLDPDHAAEIIDSRPGLTDQQRTAAHRRLQELQTAAARRVA